MQHLLSAEDDGRHKIDEITYDLATFRPHFAIDGVALIFVSDIVCSDQHLLSERDDGQENHQSQDGQAAIFFGCHHDQNTI